MPRPGNRVEAGFGTRPSRLFAICRQQRGHGCKLQSRCTKRAPGMTGMLQSRFRSRGTGKTDCLAIHSGLWSAVLRIASVGKAGFTQVAERGI